MSSNRRRTEEMGATGTVRGAEAAEASLEELPAAAPVERQAKGWKPGHAGGVLTTILPIAYRL
jgi:hypothetical protein